MLPHQSVYCAGKYAATGWSETIATELRKDGIQVSTVYPPPLDDGAPLHVHYKGRVEDEFRWFTRTLTSPFRATRPERAARAAVEAAASGVRVLGEKARADERRYQPDGVDRGR